MKFLFLLVFLLFSCFSVQAQLVKVSGKCVSKNNQGIQGVVIEVSTYKRNSFISDSTGEYTFFANRGDTLKVRYRFDGQFIQRETIVIESVAQTIETVKFNVSNIRQITLVEEKKDPFELEYLKPLDYRKITGSVEKSLVYSTPATSNNELTSNYNVRGGNYDENLVYVNGFQVYRPFLTRSGQQEGMSFIHSSLVQSLQFSAGGFQANYGDRLSSVLDITYKSPDSLESGALISLLGVEAYVGQRVNQRFNYLIGSRYRSNGYLLNSLPTKGAYNPVFMDAQLLATYSLTEKTDLVLLGHYSSNNFRFSPESQKTDFGVANEAYTFSIYFDGQEQTKFETSMGGFALKHRPTKQLNLDFYTTMFYSDEKEYFDVLGQYYINQLETDPSKEEFGDSIAVLGIGSFLNHGRNRLKATIANVYHEGEFRFKSIKTTSSLLQHQLKWGLNFQVDQFSDTLSEWKLLDSAGYSLPQGSPTEVELFETIKNRAQLNGSRSTAYLQWNIIRANIKKNVQISVPYKDLASGKAIKKIWLDTLQESASKWAISIGSRMGYTSVNKELYVTPRFSLQYFPRNYMVQKNKLLRRQVVYRFATGLYYQPPFYREFRDFGGNLQLDVKSQKSLHAILGTDYFFQLWGRNTPFKLSAEIYYKYLWNINPYEIDNVRTRYYATNNARGFAYGMDANINGEFVPGIESFFKVGLMTVQEDIEGDAYKVYYNQNGERIIFGYSEDQTIADSAIIEPGFIPRPTDQLLTIGMLIQDQMPNLEQFSVQMGLQYGSRLPYGPPDRERFKDTLRMKSYFRVDIGFSYDLLSEQSKIKNKRLIGLFENAEISLEIFNLLGIRNVLSKQWIQDVKGTFFSVPNYLTNRRINLKLLLQF
jgi:hypothetical protein